MSAFLSKKEMYELTGAKKRYLQISWLNERGYPYEVRIDGSPVVAKTFVEKKLNKTINSNHNITTPDFSALRAYQNAHASTS